jgi:hypothetical protein
MSGDFPSPGLNTATEAPSRKPCKQKVTGSNPVAPTHPEDQVWVCPGGAHDRLTVI